MTADARVAPTPTPPPPHDPEKVASIVKYGLAEGELEFEERGNTRVVFEYKYGKGYGDMTYQVCAFFCHSTAVTLGQDPHKIWRSAHLCMAFDMHAYS